MVRKDVLESLLELTHLRRAKPIKLCFGHPVKAPDNSLDLSAGVHDACLAKTRQQEIAHNEEVSLDLVAMLLVKDELQPLPCKGATQGAHVVAYGSGGRLHLVCHPLHGAAGIYAQYREEHEEPPALRVGWIYHHI